MSGETYPDVEGAVRALLRADTGVAALVGQRVFFGVPKNAKADDFPLVTVARVGGSQEPGPTPVDNALVQVECWGTFTAGGNGDKAAATALLNAVRSALDVTQPVTPTTGQTILGADSGTVVWLPDPDTDRPRYVLTAEVSAINTS